jgi:hypothetical protein
VRIIDKVRKKTGNGSGERRKALKRAVVAGHILFIVQKKN